MFHAARGFEKLKPKKTEEELKAEQVLRDFEGGKYGPPPPPETKPEKPTLPTKPTPPPKPTKPGKPVPPPPSTETEEEKESGIEIDLKLPHKKINSLEMLSGGERSLVGIAALFALISVSPPPFLVLDEIDAALAERNSRRFSEMLREFSKKSQFIVVTHNRATMEVADVLYGLTLSDDGTSKILSLKLES